MRILAVGLPVCALALAIAQGGSAPAQAQSARVQPGQTPQQSDQSREQDRSRAGDVKIGRDWKDKEPEWKADEAFYSGAAGDLVAIKNAWRNPAMHVRGIYDEERALEIFNATKGFMRHLAAKLAEPSQ